MNVTDPTAYAIEGFRLDLSRRRLSDPAGRAVPLSARAFDVLAYLVENRARVVGKDELMRAVWARVVVEENNLSQAVYNVRKALGDAREAPRFIVTVAGRGYQFIAQVQPDPATTTANGRPEPPAIAPESIPSSPTILPDQGPRELPVRSETAAAGEPSSLQAGEPAESVAFTRRHLLAAGAAVAVGLAGLGWWLGSERSGRQLPSSLAVLPFKPLLEPAANPAVELGITETLINRLSALPGIVVSPLSSVRRFSGVDTDPLQAGSELGVGAVLDGYVQIDKDHLRLTARLLDVDDGRALWSGSFKARLDDFFTVQESLANQVVNALSVELSPQQVARLARRDTSDPDAWQMYLSARYHWYRRSEEGFVRALELYEAAVRRDPAFALAEVGISEVLAVQGVFNMRPPTLVFPRARIAVERAIELDAELAEARASLGHIKLQFDRDWREGERLYRRALEMRPTLTQAVFWLANCLMMQGRIEESLAEGRRSQALEPMVVLFAANLGMLLTFARQFDRAYAQLAGLYESAPDSPLLRHHLARLHVVRGEPQEAIRLVEGFAPHAPGSLSNLGRAYALAGRSDHARAELGKLQALAGKGFGVGYDSALMYAALGERESALSALESGLVDHSQMMLYLKVEPGFDALRDEPRFRAIVERLDLD